MKLIKFRIESIFGSILFEYECQNNTLSKTVQKAIKSEVSLRYADLTDANLTDANLTRADLTDANLTRANLTRANLTRADLTDANLTDANLTDANLTRANLTDADLTRANLTRADLTDANLTRANLTDANLRKIENDFKKAIRILPSEIANLREKLIQGKIDGSSYEGDCACLAGTIANHLNCNYKDLDKEFDFKVAFWSSRERWFLRLRPGMNPQNSIVARITLKWIDEVLEELKQ